MATTTQPSEGRPELTEGDDQLRPLAQRFLTGGLLLAQWQRVLEDCDRLRSCALDSKGNVVRPAALAQSIKLREKAIAGSLNGLRQIWDIKRIEAFYKDLGDIMVEELVGFPETHQKILDRIAILNSGVLADERD